jgi:hypothetical protein
LSLTRTQIRALLYQRIPGLGAVGTADSVAATSITDAFLLQDANRGANSLRGRYLYRPNRSDDDRVKRTGALSGATLSHTGSSYTNTTDLSYELVGYMHPDELNACIARAVKKLTWELRLPLSLWQDGDMDDATVNAYTTGDVGGTSSKTSVSGQVHSGRRALQFISDSGAGPHFTLTLPRAVAPGQQLYVAAVARTSQVNTTLRFTLLNVVGMVPIGDPVQTQSQNWVHLWMLRTVPTGCANVMLKIEVLEASKVVYVDVLPGHVLGELNYPAPSWLDESFKLLGLSEANYRSQVSPGVEIASSRQWEDWFSPRDFVVQDFDEEVTADWLTITRPDGRLPTRDLWLHGRRPYSDVKAFNAEADATMAPENEVLAACELEIAELLHQRYPNEPRWAEMVAAQQRDLAAERAARPPTPMRPQVRRFGGRI